MTERGRQRGWLLASLGGLLVLVAVFAAGLYAGAQLDLSGQASPGQLEQGGRQQDGESGDERWLAMAQELEIARTRSEVDRAALQMLRRELAEQKDRNANLEEGLRFYRSLMAPEEIAQGLSLRPIELVAGERAGRFAFRIVVQQEARKHSILKGALQAEVYGLLEGEQVNYSLAEMADDLEAGDLALRFRYFQAIEGMLTLPAGFEPQGVRVNAKATSPSKVEVSEDFQWRVQERFTHVGK